MSLRRAMIWLPLSVYVQFLLCLTLLRFSSRDPVPNMVPLRSMIGDWRAGGAPFVVNFLGNIVAFLPIGMIPALAWPRRAGVWQAALFSLAFSSVIEAAQYASGRRVADVDDLILNTLGGILGFVALSFLIRPRGRASVADGCPLPGRSPWRTIDTKERDQDPRDRPEAGLQRRPADRGIEVPVAAGSRWGGFPPRGDPPAVGEGVGSAVHTYL